MVAETEIEWRNSVDAQLVALNDHCKSNASQITDAVKTVERLAADVGAALTIHAANAEQISNNTKITLDVSAKLDELSGRVRPVLEVTETMTRGAAAVGKFISFSEKWGGRLLRLGFAAGAFWLFAKVLLGGAGWTEAIRAFVGVGSK